MNIQEKYIWSLKWVSIGDALGLPVEMHTRSQIIRLLDQEFLGCHDGLIDHYYPIGRHGMYRKDIPSPSFPELAYSSTGICSDDTILTLALADSIQEQWGINMDDIIDRHARAVRDEPFGFWKGTRTSMEQIANGVDWKTKKDVSFGNGVMMKQSPFAFYEAMTWEKVSDALITLAQITHAHPVSLVITKLHHSLLVDMILSSDENFDMWYWLNEWTQYAKICEDEFHAERMVSWLLSDIQKDLNQWLTLEDIYKKYVRRIWSEKNPAFNVLSTLWIVYAIFARRQDFVAVQQWASIGWDTDSYASIIGSMSGAILGDIFPEGYITELHPRYRNKLDFTIQSNI